MSSTRFDFTEYLDTLAAPYIPRPRLEETISAAVQQRSCGVCVITGEPGSGKTSLAAMMVRRLGLLHYFVRRGHVDFSIWRDPYAFLITIGYQIWERYGDSVFPPAVAIDIEGKVRNVDQGATVIGAEVERLVPLPWRSSRITVDLDARNIRGTAVGARVREVVEDYRFLSVETFRDIALIDPLRRLAEQRPGEKLVLWVDGLDEELDGPSTANATTITSLLPNAADACELGNLVVVATSRPGGHLGALSGGDAVVLELSDARLRDESNETIAALVDRELADGDVEAALTAAKWDKDELRQQILERSQENFLYAKHFFLGVRNGETNALREHTLPSSLDEIHARLIARFVDSARPGDPATLRAVIVVLSVAREPLHIEQLAFITGVAEGTVRSALSSLLPYLNHVQARGADAHGRYEFFHDTFRETLTAASHRNEAWHVDPAAANGLLADSYMVLEEGGWAGLDDYGRQFLTDHLRWGTAAHQRRLVSLIGEPWRRALRARLPTNRAFANDIAKAFDCLASLPEHQIVPYAAQLTQMAASVNRAAREVPDGAVTVMAKLGQHARAFEYVVPGPTANWYVARSAELLRGLAAASVPDWSLIQRARAMALASMREQPDHGSLAIILEACPVGDDPDSKTFLDAAIEQFNQAPSYWATPRALTHVARLLSAYDLDEAAKVCGQCRDTIPELCGPSLSLSLFELFEAWSDFDPARALQATMDVQWVPDSYSIRALLAVHLAVEREDHAAAIDAIVAAIEQQLLPAVSDPYHRALAELALARAELEVGSTERATTWLDSAVAVVERIGGADDPERETQTRPQMATECWIAAASVATAAGCDAGGRLIEGAWREALQHGIFNDHDGTRALIRAQFARRPELLEARLEGISGEATRARFLVAASDVVAEQDEQGAAALLEQALAHSERATGPQLGHEDELALAIAVQAGAAAGLAVLESAHAENFELDWRFALLHAEWGDATARAEWVLTALDAWSASSDNQTLERAVMLACLPDEFLEPLVGRLGDIHSESHRSILTGALSARVARLDRARGEAMLMGEVARIDEVLANERRLRTAELLALFAGAWWHLDRVLAERLWCDALMRATSWAGATPRDRSHEIALALAALQLGAPDAVLAPLLCHEPPPPDPSTFTFVVAGPSTPPLVAAGMDKISLLFGAALAGAMSRSETARGRFEAIDDPALASMTASCAALHNVDANLEQRADWCQTALDRAAQVAEHHLSCLLHADAAEALLAVGLKTWAREVAESTALNIVENGHAFGAVLQEPAYAHGMGRCLRTLGGSCTELELAGWIWRARVLQAGLCRFLTYAPALLTGSDQNASLGELLEADARAAQLFRDPAHRS